MEEQTHLEQQKRMAARSESILVVDNLSCGGCAHTIEKNLMELAGIEAVRVNLENSEVIIRHGEQVNLAEVKERLKHLGYPEQGTTHGLEKIGRNLKSYVSCAIGRMDHSEIETAKPKN